MRRLHAAPENERYPGRRARSRFGAAKPTSFAARGGRRSHDPPSLRRRRGRSSRLNPIPASARRGRRRRGLACDLYGLIPLVRVLEPATGSQTPQRVMLKSISSGARDRRRDARAGPRRETIFAGATTRTSSRDAAKASAAPGGRAARAAGTEHSRSSSTIRPGELSRDDPHSSALPLPPLTTTTSRGPPIAKDGGEYQRLAVNSAAGAICGRARASSLIRHA